MGPNPSRVAKPSYENYNSFAGDREAIFEVSPDEQAFCLDELYILPSCILQFVVEYLIK